MLDRSALLNVHVWLTLAAVVCALGLSACGGGETPQTIPVQSETLSTVRLGIGPGRVTIAEAVAALDDALVGDVTVGSSVDTNRTIDVPADPTALELLAMLTDEHQIVFGYEPLPHATHRGVLRLGLGDRAEQGDGPFRAMVTGPILVRTEVRPPVNRPRAKLPASINHRLEYDPRDLAVQEVKLEVRLPDGSLAPLENIPHVGIDSVDLVGEVTIRRLGGLHKVVIPLGKKTYRWGNYRIWFVESRNIEPAGDPYDNTGVTRLDFEVIDRDAHNTRFEGFYASNQSLDPLPTYMTIREVFGGRKPHPDYVEFSCDDPSFDRVVVFMGEWEPEETLSIELKDIPLDFD